MQTRQKIYREAKRIGGQVVAFPMRFVNRLIPTHRVAFRSTGGIGDHIIAARFLRDLIDSAGPFPIDIICNNPEVCKWVFESLPGDIRILVDRPNWSGWQSRYPVYIAITGALSIVHIRKSWKKSVKSQNLQLIIEKIKRNRTKLVDLCMNQHPVLDATLARYAFYIDKDRYNLCHYMAGIECGSKLYSLGKEQMLDEFEIPNDRPYITIHNGFDTNDSPEDTLCTKVYPHFSGLIEVLREIFPEFYLIQVGSITSRPIAGVDLSLVDRTSLPQLTAVVSGAALHIDGESGIVHIAACAGVRSCVVFGSTPEIYFGYPDNINISPSECGGCWWSDSKWRSKCLRGDSSPRCVSNIPPKRIVDALAPHLNAVLGRSGYVAGINLER